MEVLMATPEPAINQAKQQAFVQKVLGDTSATMTTILASIGDRLGLFKDLAANGPTTSVELARRTGTNERYVREWLGGMTAAGYLEYDASTHQFSLPAEHAAAVAAEGGPFFFGGIHEMIPALVTVIDQVTEAFRKGGGVRQANYPSAMWDGLERFTAGWFNNLLVQQWIPAMPNVQSKFERGVRVADVGCGRGRALIKLAQAYPACRYSGYDVYGPAVEEATARAEAAGVQDRVTFQQVDVSKGLPGQYDVITTFDVIHDAVDPLGILRVLRRALAPDGVYVCLDINCSDKLEENIGPLGALFHGFSVLYCMTTSLAWGGAGLGTVGLHEKKVLELCSEAGFRSIRRVPLENPFNNLYEIMP
jgi:2-polyprenyl-3-methyl-5-hydroxy-6-metoxy-1,4-benzoquinol methylase